MDAQKMKEIFASNLKKYLDRNGINQTYLANSIHVPETTVSNWIKANTYPRPDKIQLLADYSKINRSDLTEEKPSNLYEASIRPVKVPILGKIACGLPIYAEENFEGFRYEASDILPQGEVYYLEAKGNSMEPTIPNGSFVLIRKQDDVENGEIAAVLINGDTEATLKRVKKQGNVVILMPDNSSYEPIILTSNVPARIIGKAIRFTKDL
ncbi:XRE family transcriptional regulator [Bacillus pseudomycoides]|uniref:LexA family protein n=1 Tax=Bacillus pseudomycoides TaxID=64104 RepID=UPI000BED18BD|nr:XRE family transcriptional regulator [Bacillus pseudomycoides]PDX97510.1 XRE family transcriptional regulator [Bacillus pseudomycoides]PEK78115.1 XRE family transcriptional regulator [Bacillus pseudomycoides]PEN01380.1 XRE family transcriptional regulator [Bacillus pseudomycoides]PGB89078.1 XRE family transcriptional regulator [Bacillus pseudomycoides]PHE55250.1 XRE family transcriptional regulator [Bacillus pseudomycoides]